MKPASCLTLLSNEELRQETLRLNREQSKLSVECKQWFKLAWLDGQVWREIERRMDLFRKPNLKPHGRKEVDVSGLKRVDFSKWPAERLISEIDKMESRIFNTAQNMKDTIDLRKVHAMDDQRGALIKSKHFLAGVTVPDLENVVRIQLNEAITAMDNLNKRHNFRIALNRRISLFQEILNRHETRHPNRLAET